MLTEENRIIYLHLSLTIRENVPIQVFPFYNFVSSIHKNENKG